MTGATKGAILMLACWLISIAACYGQGIEAEPFDPVRMKSQIDEQNRQLAGVQANFKKLMETGASLFGRTKAGIDTTLSPLNGKAPEDYQVGDWGRPASQLAVFTVVQKVQEDALLITSKKGTWFWLQGVDTSKAAERMQFMLPRMVTITGTKTYETAVGASKTVLVMECDEEKVLRAVELAQKRDEEAGWRTWTLVKQPATRTRTPRRPYIINSDTIVAKFLKSKGGTVTLEVRLASNEDGVAMDFLAKELSDADREYIRERANGTAKKPGSQRSTTTAAVPAKPSTPPLESVADVPASAAHDASSAGKEDSRSRWLNESYDTTIRHVKGKVWEHVENKTGRVGWVGKETGRTDDYIELLSERNEELRIMAKRMELKQNGKWGWVANGHWESVGDNVSEAPTSAAPAAKEDSRERWLNETYNATVRYVKSKNVWEEVENKTGRVVWVDKEVARTADYVELFSPERKYEIRLRTERMEQKIDGKWQWVGNGRWDTAAAPSPRN